MEDEIDLRQYVMVLLRHWKLILGLPLVAALVAFGVTSFLPKSYEATTVVVVTSPRFVMQFVPQIETATGGPQINPKAYLGLAVSDELLTRLLADPAVNTLSPDERTLDGMRARLKATAGTDSTLLNLKASDTDPARAAAIANAWGALFTQYINNLYSLNQSSQTFFETQAGTAKTKYDTAQQALEGFLGQNRMTELQREISLRQDLIKQYQAEQTASQGQPLSQQMQSRRQILADAYSELTLIEGAERQIISDDYNALVAWENLLKDAIALRQEVAQAGVASTANVGSRLAQLLLSSHSLAGSADNNVQLQVSLDSPSAPVTEAEVESLIRVLETRQVETRAHLEALLQLFGQSSRNLDEIERVDSRFAALEKRKIEVRKRIDALSTTLLTDLRVGTGLSADDPVSQLIKQYETEELNLTAELEAEQARQRELIQARDLAWDTYTVITRKAEETRLASQSGEAEVQLASMASTPVNPTGSGRLYTTGVAGAVALMLAVVGVFGREWWKGAVKA